MSSVPQSSPIRACVPRGQGFSCFNQCFIPRVKGSGWFVIGASPEYLLKEGKPAELVRGVNRACAGEVLQR